MPLYRELRLVGGRGRRLPHAPLVTLHITKFQHFSHCKPPTSTLLDQLSKKLNSPCNTTVCIIPPEYYLPPVIRSNSWNSVLSNYVPCPPQALNYPNFSRRGLCHVPDSLTPPLFLSSHIQIYDSSLTNPSISNPSEST